MKTWMKLALMSLVSVALVACGGGGLQKISLPEALQTTDTVWMDGCASRRECSAGSI